MFTSGDAGTAAARVFGHGGRSARPVNRGGVIGLSLGKFAWAGAGVALLALCAPAWGGPKGEKVVRGEAEFARRGNRTVIRASDKAIINYDSFNIARNETVKFVQPSAASKVLNRITGDDPSRIDGTLKANGVVYIVNRAGVYFSQGSLVDVGGIYAAAGNISDQDFAAGRDRFTGVQGAVVNEGRVEVAEGGTAALIGREVSNRGVMVGDRATIAMVAGEDVYFTKRGDTLTVKVEGLAGSPTAPAVDNAGRVEARRGRALFSAGDVVSLAVRNSGTVRAGQIAVKGEGRGIVEVGGTLDARNGGAGIARGGSVEVTGEKVALVDARIDASGRRGGGEIKIGGDFHGGGALSTASATQVSDGTELRADAFKRGDGGEVVVWSDTHTGYYGSASATGGAIAGDGGRIETSGKQTLDIRGGTADAGAPSERGDAGVWLMDPFDVTIDAAATSGGTFGGGNPDIFTPTTAAVVDVAAINTALDGGTSVEITTGGAGGGASAGTITLATGANISKSAGGNASLTLRAANDIVLNADITASTGQLTFNLLANNSDGGNIDNDAAAGSITVAAGRTISTNGGAALFEGVGIDIGAGTVITANGGVTLRPTDDAATIGLGGGAGDFNLTLAELATISSTDNVTIGRATGIGAVDINALALGTEAFGLSVTGGSISTESITLPNDRTLNLTANTGTITRSGAAVLSATGALGEINLTASGGVGTSTEALTIDTSTSSITASGAGADAFVESLNGMTVTVAVNDDLQLAVGGGADLNGTVGGNLDASIGGALSSAGLTVDGDALIESTGFNDDINLLATTIGGTVSFATSGSGSVNLVSPDAVDLGASAIGGNLGVTSEVGITDSGVLTIGNNLALLTINDAGGDIILDASHTVGGNVNLSALDGAGVAPAAGDIAFRDTDGLLVLSSAVTASDLALQADDMSISSIVARDLSLSALTPGQAISINNGATGLALSLSELQSIDASGTLTIGAADAGAIGIGSDGPVDLSGRAYNLSLAGGAVTFTDLLTLPTGRRLTITGTGGVDGSNPGLDVQIAGAGGSLVIDAAGAIDLDTDLRLLSATTTVGDIAVRNTGDLALGSSTLDGIVGAPGGNISALTTGAMTVAGAVTATGSGTITLTADAGDGGDIAVNAAVSGVSGAIRLLADNDVAFSSDGEIRSTGLATITITADADSANSGGAGTGGDITLAEGAEISTPGGAIIVEADGDITDAADDPTPATTFAANTLMLESASGRVGGSGGGGAIDTAVASLEAIGPAGVSIINSGDLLARLNASGGAVSIVNTGTLATNGVNWIGGTISASSTGAMTLNDSVITDQAGGITLNSNGLLTLAAGETLTVAGSAPIALNTTDLALLGTIAAAGSTVTITRPTVGTIGLGDAAGDLVISKAELANITAALLEVGGANTRAITVDNAADADTANIETVRLLATDNGATITFSGVGSSFNALTADADDGITVNANLLTDVGSLTLNGDADGSPDTADRISIGSGVTLQTTAATGDLELSAPNGGIQGSGALTLTAGRNLTINDSISSSGLLTLNAGGTITLGGPGTGQPITISADDGLTISANLTNQNGATTIDADADNDGTGVFTIGTGASLATNGNTLSVTAADAVIDGEINAGSGTVTFVRSTAGTIGLGAAAGDLQLSAGELSRITAASLNIGNELATALNAENVAAADLDGIASLVTLTADDMDFTGEFNTADANLVIRRGTDGAISLGTATGGLTLSNADLDALTTNDLTLGSLQTTNAMTISGVTAAASDGIDGLLTLTSSGTMTFSGGASAFNALAASAQSGMTVSSNLTTDRGNLSLDGNSNDDAVTTHNIAISSGRTLTSAGALNLAATSGGIDAAGSLTLNAADGIVLSDELSTNGVTNINADTDGAGAGALTVASGRSLLTNSNTLNISAHDLVLEGSITTGAAFVNLRRSRLGTIGLGNSDGGMAITGAELGRIIATGMTIGGTNTSRIDVSGVTAANSNGITGTLTLEALGDMGSVRFLNTASTFNALTARANNGVIVDVALTTDAGAIVLNGNADGVADGFDVVRIGANISAPNTSNMTVQSDARLSGNAVISANNIQFDGRINNGQNQGRRTLTLNTSGTGVTTLSGAVGDLVPIGALTTNADGTTRIGANVRTEGGQNFNDPVVITRNVTLTEDAAASGIFFAGTVNSSAGTPRGLTLITDTTVAGGSNTQPVISFNGDVGATNPLAFLRLNTNGSNITGHTQTPRVATIIARARNASGQVTAGERNLRVRTTGDITMGVNEKLTVAGDLSLTSTSGVVTLADVTALGDVTVSAPTIRVRSREGAQLLSNLGTIDTDLGTDIVSGGIINFSTAPTQLGSGPAPIFASPDGTGAANNNLNAFIFRAFGDLSASLINFQASSSSAITTLDLRSQGPTNTNVSEILAGAIPRESRQNDVGQSTSISQAEQDKLRQLGISAREITADELLDLLMGSALYNDLPLSERPSPDDFTTAVNRLPSEQVAALLRAYDELFNTPVLDEAGQPKLDENGRPMRAGRSKEIRDSLLASVRRFRTKTSTPTGDIDPVSFRGYFEVTPEESASLGYMRQLKEFVRQLDLLGLTPRELSRAKGLLLRDIRPAGVGNLAKFEAIILAEPPPAAEELDLLEEAAPTATLPGIQDELAALVGIFAEGGPAFQP